MKWAVPELIKLNKPVLFDETLAFDEEVVGFNGVKKISPVHIWGQGEKDGKNFRFDLNISCKLILTCAISLEDVPYELDIQQTEFYGFDNSLDEDIYLIDGQTIDLHQAILTNIIVNIPYRVVKEGCEIEETEDESLEEIDPRFQVLKDYFK